MQISPLVLLLITEMDGEVWKMRRYQRHASKPMEVVQCGQASLHKAQQTLADPSTRGAALNIIDHYRRTGE